MNEQQAKEVLKQVAELAQSKGILSFKDSAEKPAPKVKK
jgi:hypothetical protein